MHIIHSENLNVLLQKCRHVGYGAQLAVSLASNFSTTLKY